MCRPLALKASEIRHTLDSPPAEATTLPWHRASAHLGHILIRPSIFRMAVSKFCDANKADLGKRLVSMPTLLRSLHDIIESKIPLDKMGKCSLQGDD